VSAARLILASASAARRAMLEAAGVAHESIPAAIDERALEARLGSAPPAAIALALAEAKAAAISAAHAGTLVLGSDSLVLCKGRRFDKPQSRAEAAQHLRFFAGRVMELHSAAALVKDGVCTWRHASLARLHVRPLSEAFIEDYLAREWPAIGQTVGAFRIEGPGVQLFEAIEGDHFTVLGMPLIAVLEALRGEGVLIA
jgi:septum formation protein